MSVFVLLAVVLALPWMVTARTTRRRMYRVAGAGPGHSRRWLRVGDGSPGIPSGLVPRPARRDGPTRRRTRHTGRRDSGPGDSAEQIDVSVLLELVAAAITSGASIPRALEAVGHAVGGGTGQELQRAGAAIVLGASWDRAFTPANKPVEVVRRALAPAWENGAAPTEALRAAGDQLRQNRQAKAKQAAARLAVHLVMPLGACFLPAFVLIGLLPLLISLASGVLQP